MEKLKRNADGTLSTLACLDDVRCVKVDLPCQSCGYNLRTQHIDAACPECGVPVKHAFLTPAHLADRRWLAMVRYGSFIIVFGVFARFAFCCISDVPGDIEALQSAFFFFVGLPFTVGLWLFAAGERGVNPMYQQFGSRLTLRIASVFELVMLAALPLSGVMHTASYFAAGVAMIWAIAHLVVVGTVTRLVYSRQKRMHAGLERYATIPAALLYALGPIALAVMAAINVSFAELMLVVLLPGIGGVALLYMMVELAGRLYPLDPDAELEDNPR